MAQGTVGAKADTSGLKAFKEAVGRLNVEMKTLQTEMKATTSQFDKSDRSMGSYIAKNKVLEKQITKQKEAVKKLEDALEESKRLYGDNDTKTHKWQQSLNNAKANLNKLNRELDQNKEAMKSAGKWTDSASSKFKKIGSTFGKVAKVAGAATLAIGAAAGALGKAAISAYADSEQLVGGVDTLFKGSSKQVQKYANDAFKTAGMDANTYMETVTGFSASLIKSVGGDTEKAAKLADQAITDMSDNANKMGTDMESIKNAYQGFAKQNYTMLDNLKLGYGGTKEEMQKLLKDAEKISGIKYDISSYADITQAIHVMQEEMDIAGTTAKEANDTIQGSFNSTKSAFKNLIAGMGNPSADIEKLVDNIVKSASNLAKNVMPIIDNLIKALLTTMKHLIPELKKSLPGIINTINKLFPQILKAIVDLLPTLVPVVAQAVLTVMNAIIDNLPLLLQAGAQMILELAKGLTESLPTLVPKTIDVIMQFVDTLVDNLDVIVDAGIDLIIALSVGIAKAIPKIVEKIPEIMFKLVLAIAKAVPKIRKAGIDIVINLAKGVISGATKFYESCWAVITKVIAAVKKALPGIISIAKEIPKKIWEGISTYVSWITSKVKGFGSSIAKAIKNGIGNMKDIGKNMVQGIWNGINDAAGWISDKIKGFCGNVTSKIKGFFGIHSPSTLMRDEVGKFLGLGVGVGFGDSMKEVSAKMNSSLHNAIPKNVDYDVNAKLNTSANNIKGTSMIDYEGLGDVLANSLKKLNLVVVMNDEVVGNIADSRIAYAIGR